MDTISQWIQENLGISDETETRIVASVITLVAIWLLRYLVMALVSRRVTDMRLRYRIQKSSRYIAGFFAVLVVGRVWFEGIQSLATFLGLLTAGLAIALKDPITNLAGWLFIVSRRPFEVGDRIQIGQLRGDVIDIALFQFSLLEIGNWVHADQSTGRVIHVPNGQVFTTEQANYTQGFEYIWNEIPVLVTFESNWKRAKEILLDLVNRLHRHTSTKADAQIRDAARKYLIFYKTLTPTVYTEVRDCGVLLTIRYLCKARQRRGTAQTLWEETLEAFADCPDIDFAYPTQRFYDNRLEGKGQSGPAAPGGAGATVAGTQPEGGLEA